MPTVTIRIKDIEGVSHELEVDDDIPMSILDLAHEKGIDLPYSCRSGACFSCCAEVQEGSEWIDNAKTGEQLIDVDENETLTCISGVSSHAFDDDEDKMIEIEMLN